jgi:transcriptional regulator of heat shock response
MSEERKKSLLKKIVETFIIDAKPLASTSLVGKIKEKVSSATIRNDMATLEKEGFIYQPHTSSGRIPTEKAYRFYIENYLDKEKPLTAKEKSILQELKKEESEDRMKIKNFAKAISDLSKQGVMVAFSECDNYYTGLSNIFAQPEFHNSDQVVNLSTVVEHMDSKIIDLLHSDSQEPKIMVGNENPMGKDCSLIVSSYKIGKYKGIIALIGPQRMDYQKNYLLLKEASKLLK